MEVAAKVEEGGESDAETDGDKRCDEIEENSPTADAAKFFRVRRACDPHDHR